METNDKMTQCKRIIEYLKVHKSISNAKAMYDIGVASLSRRICDLKASGYKITSEFVSDKNRYGERTRYKVYRMEGEANDKKNNLQINEV